MCIQMLVHNKHPVTCGLHTNPGILLDLEQQKAD
jgi:hypothetical protein